MADINDKINGNAPVHGGYPGIQINGTWPKPSQKR